MPEIQLELQLEYPTSNYVVTLSGWKSQQVYCDTIEQVWEVKLKANCSTYVSSPTGKPTLEFVAY